jgi:hypothetical protein
MLKEFKDFAMKGNVLDMAKSLNSLSIDPPYETEVYCIG